MEKTVPKESIVVGWSPAEDNLAFWGRSKENTVLLPLPTLQTWLLTWEGGSQDGCSPPPHHQKSKNDKEMLLKTGNNEYPTLLQAPKGQNKSGNPASFKDAGGKRGSKSHRLWHIILKMACAHQTPKTSFLPTPWFNNSIKCLLALPQCWGTGTSLLSGHQGDPPKHQNNGKVPRAT